MAKVNGNDLVAQALADEGVDTVFYLTGGPMVDVAVALYRALPIRRRAS